MILPLAEMWSRLHVRSIDLFPPVAAVTSITGGGDLIRSRPFGADLWRASVTLAPGDHADKRAERALLIRASQVGVMFEADDPSWRGTGTGVTVLSRAADNRSLTLAGLAPGRRLEPGDMLSIGRNLYSVLTANAASATGRAQVSLVPTILPSTVVGMRVELARPRFVAVMDKIRPALFEAVVAGEVSFTLTQVVQ